MKLIPLYETHEVNGEITYRKLYFKPKGLCKFYAIVEYAFKDIRIVVEMETAQKIPREKFSKWTQEILHEVEKEFYGKVNYERLVNQDFDLSNQVIGKYEAFVVV